MESCVVMGPTFKEYCGILLKWVQNNVSKYEKMTIKDKPQIAKNTIERASVADKSSFLLSWKYPNKKNWICPGKMKKTGQNINSKNSLSEL